jgi:hypothetical protein
MSARSRAPSRVVPWLSAIAAFAGIHALFAALQPWFFRVASYDGQWTVAHVPTDLGGRRPDIVFLGSSRVVTGLDPAVVERDVAAATGVPVRALNLGVTGATADTSRLVLKNLIGDDVRPKVVVYAIYELEMLAAPGTHARQNLPYLSSIERLDDFADYRDESWRRRAWFLTERALPVERDRRLVRDALDIVFTSAAGHDLYEADAPPPGEQGFHRVPVGTPDPDPDRARREYAGALRRPHLSDAGALRLERLVDLARERAIDIVLVDLPVSARHRAFWARPPDLAAYLARVGEIAEREHVPLLELYENPGELVPERGFTDTHQLNELGAAIASHEVAVRLLVPRLRPAA